MAMGEDNSVRGQFAVRPSRIDGYSIGAFLKTNEVLLAPDGGINGVKEFPHYCDSYVPTREIKFVMEGDLSRDESEAPVRSRRPSSRKRLSFSQTNSSGVEIEEELQKDRVDGESQVVRQRDSTWDIGLDESLSRIDPLHSPSRATFDYAEKSGASQLILPDRPLVNSDNFGQQSPFNRSRKFSKEASVISLNQSLNTVHFAELDAIDNHELESAVKFQDQYAAAKEQLSQPKMDVVRMDPSGIPSTIGSTTRLNRNDKPDNRNGGRHANVPETKWVTTNWDSSFPVDRPAKRQGNPRGSRPRSKAHASRERISTRSPGPKSNVQLHIDKKESYPWSLEFDSNKKEPFSQPFSTLLKQEKGRPLVAASPIKWPEVHPTDLEASFYMNDEDDGLGDSRIASMEQSMDEAKAYSPLRTLDFEKMSLSEESMHSNSSSHRSETSVEEISGYNRRKQELDMLTAMADSLIDEVSLVVGSPVAEKEPKNGRRSVSKSRSSFLGDSTNNTTKSHVVNKKVQMHPFIIL